MMLKFLLNIVITVNIASHAEVSYWVTTSNPHYLDKDNMP